MLQWHVRYFEELASTQDYLRQHHLDLPSGTCVVSEKQTCGYGRQKRVWYSESGGLYFSILLKPQQILTCLPWALLWTGLETLEFFSGCSLSIKAPNDLLYKTRKIAGMLIDSRLCADVPEYYICGMGINLNQTSFPDELKDGAVSLFQMTGRVYSVEAVVHKLLDDFHRKYVLLHGSDFEAEMLKTLGNRELRISYNGENIAFKEYWHGQ